MTNEIDYLENVSCGLYETIASTADPKVKAELRAAQEAIDNEIEERYELAQSAPKIEKGIDLDAEKRKGKVAAREMLKRVAAIGGQKAVDYALSLPDTMSLEEIERVATRAAATGALTAPAARRHCRRSSPIRAQGDQAGRGRVVFAQPRPMPRRLGIKCLEGRRHNGN